MVLLEVAWMYEPLVFMTNGVRLVSVAPLHRTSASTLYGFEIGRKSSSAPELATFLRLWMRAYCLEGYHVHLWTR